MVDHGDSAFVSLKEFMGYRFDRIEAEVASLKQTVEELRSALQKMAVDAAVVQSTAKRVDEIEERLIQAEQTVRILKWIGGVLTAVIIPLIIAVLKSVLGL